VGSGSTFTLLPSMVILAKAFSAGTTTPNVVVPPPHVLAYELTVESESAVASENS
jgi:hypothetical protein